MTIAEVIRAMESYNRVRKREAQEKASLDYTLAILIGNSVGRVFTDTKYPEIYEAYPAYFDKDEIEGAKQKQKDELSALRLQQFAESFNKKLAKKGGQS